MAMSNDSNSSQIGPLADPSFDSASLQRIIILNRYSDTFANRLKDFYRQRNYQYAWFAGAGLAEQAANFWNAQSNYLSYTKDSSLYNPSLQELLDTVTTTTLLDDSIKLKTEIAFTVQFFRYARRAYQGNIRLGEHDLDWFIPRKRIDMNDLLIPLLRTREKHGGL